MTDRSDRNTQQVTTEIKSTINISKLSFGIAHSLHKYLESLLDQVTDLHNINCQILLPDPIIDGSLLSFIKSIPIGNKHWEIRTISIYEVTDQGQSTKLLGEIDGEHAYFSNIVCGMNHEKLAYEWQVTILKDVTNNHFSEEKDFTQQHLKLIRSTGHEVIADFEEQKPELCKV